MSDRGINLGRELRAISQVQVKKKNKNCLLLDYAIILFFSLEQRTPIYTGMTLVVVLKRTEKS